MLRLSCELERSVLMIEKFKKLSRIKQILLVTVIVATFIRVLLAVKLPLFLQADSGFDDFLMMEYAKSLVKFKWLGEFNHMTLAKGVSFPIFIVLTYYLSIPYSFALILLYLVGVILLLYSLRPYIKSMWFYFVSYLFLIYSPVMFHIENVQKVYRGGLIVCMSLIVFASMILIFNNFKDKKLSKLIKYSILGSIALPFFYYIKEDSIWIMPFVLSALGFSFIQLIIDKKIDKKIIRSIFIVLPVVSLFIVNICYCSINYFVYGEYTITDRSGTYFKEVMADIIRIDEPNEVEDIWITKSMLYKAIDNSKTLQTVKPYIDDMYVNSWAVRDNGEIGEDIIYWTLKDALGKAGVYSNGGKEVNEFYKKIDQELDKAVETGKLKLSKKKKLYISSITIGSTTKELIDYYSKQTGPALDMMITYKENDTSINYATGPMYAIIAMDHFTNSETVWPKDLSPVTEPYEVTISIITSIVSFYQSTGYIFFYVGLLGLVLFTYMMIKDIRKKKYEQLYLWLITLGFIGTFMVLFFGVLWFCSSYGGSLLRHFYNYTCGIVPIIQLLELIGLYYVVIFIKKYILKKKRVD